MSTAPTQPAQPAGREAVSDYRCKELCAAIIKKPQVAGREAELDALVED